MHLELTPAEKELEAAMAEYRKSTGRLELTWADLLNVLQSLGY